MLKRLYQSISSLTHAIIESTERRKIEFEWFKPRWELATKTDLEKLERLILMTSQELTTLLNNQTTQIGKIAKEQGDRFDELVEANKALQDLIDSGGNGITPELVKAAHEVQAALDELDAAIPDQPVEGPIP